MIETQMIMRWRSSSGQQHSIDGDFAVNIVQQDPTVDVSFDMRTYYDAPITRPMRASST
jgi:hypothetical protein